MNIFKYDLPIDDYVTVQMPDHAKILKIDTQFGIPRIWALVNPISPLKARQFRIVGTGHPITELADELEFIDTFQMYEGTLVFHVFEIGKTEIQTKKQYNETDQKPDK